jgi:hypothetical protein
MGQKMIRQTMFTTGEVDIVTWKRTDVNEYLTAAQSLLNVEVGTTGLAKKRKGTSLLYNVTGYAQFNSHMYEFVDKNGNYYLLISASGHFYVFASPSNEAQVITSTGNNVVTGYGTNVVVNGSNLIFVQDIPTPYQTGDLDNLDYTQDNDTLIISSPSYAPGRIYISAYNGSGFPTFAFQYLDIFPLPSYDFNNINYNQTTVTLSVSGSNVLTIAFAGLPAGQVFTNAWIGGEIIGGGASDIDPVGYAIITAVSQVGTTVTFTANVQIPFQTSGYATQGSQYSIRQPVWTAPASPWPAVNPVVTGYPAKVLYFQNRLWFGNTNLLNNTVFGSRINSPINFDVGTGRDTDAIVYTIGQTNSGAILWMNGGKQMEVYCQNNEFACPQDQNTALTPSTFSIRQQSSYGASPLLKPITYINDSYYSTKTGKALINYHFNGIGLTYTSSNISVASSHLVKAPSNRALLRGSDTSQDNFIYYLNPGDDTITAFQFATEYKLAALTPIEFQGDVELIDIVTIDNQVNILKFYALTEQFTVEVFDDSTRIDCNFQATMQSSGLVTGLSLLNGYTVQVVYQNQDFGQYLVVGGQITVTNPMGIADSVMIGLLYDVEITPMYVFTGAAEAPFFKQMNRIYVDYYQSLNFFINGNLVPYQNFADIQAGLPLVPQTDTAIISPVLGYDRFQTFSITQSSPFDLQITSIGYQIDSAVL